MSTIVLLVATGLGLGALYFLIASGLSLSYGLMRVLNFAHGIFLTVGAYASWWLALHLPAAAPWRFAVALAGCLVAGALAAGLVEVGLIRPLYRRHIEQVLVTVGLALAFTALVQGRFGPDPKPYPSPAWTQGVTRIAGASVPDSRLLAIAVAIAVFAGLQGFLRFSRWGLVVR
ncbi:MAG TPA: branched-chain amino acid ABC transporter permease, partial [Candidatus Dormibacteraeota bacterium]